MHRATSMNESHELVASWRQEEKASNRMARGHLRVEGDRWESG